MRRFAATIRESKDILNLRPIERWNVDNLLLSGSNITRMLGLYNNINLTSLSSSEEPIFDNINNQIVFDGINDAAIRSFPALSSAIGEFILVVYYDPNPSNAYVFFGNSNDINDRFLILSTSNGFEIIIGASVVRLYASAFKGVGYYIASFVSDGTKCKIYLDDPINEKPLTVINGINNGTWTSNQTVNVFLIGSVLANNYRKVKIKDYTLFTRVLTDSERTIAFEELNEKYNIY